MGKEEIIKKLQEAGTCTDDVQRRSILAEINDEVSKVYDEKDILSTSAKKYEEDNETLRKANMDLFLRVGEQKKPIDQLKDKTGIDEKPEEKRKFEDLLNDKGEIK